MPLELSLSVVIPAHNEAGNIGLLIDEIFTALDAGAPFEILVVNDASNDTTADEVLARKAQWAQVRLLEHQDHSGQSAALLTGMLAARYGLIVTLDGDGQNDPADIVPCVRRFDSERALDSQFAMVCGQRLKRQDSSLRRLSSTVANGVRQMVLRDNTPDTGCGLKVIDRDVLLTLPTFKHMHRFFPALVLSRGYHISSMPVNHRKRQSGRSHYGVNNRLWTGIIDLMGVAWLTRRAMRTRIKEY